MTTATYKGYISALKLAGASSAIKNKIHMFGLNSDVDVDKGWFRETVRFTVSGPENKVVQFKDWIEAAVKEYKE